MTDPLDRIAAALERLAPPPPAPADPLAHPAYLWRDGVLAAARDFRPDPLDRLVGIDAQRDAVLATLRRLAAGAPSHDVLLWGSRGNGKSALVKSAVAAVQAEDGRLALIEVGGDRVATLPHLFDLIARVPRAYALFVDDLGIDAAEDARALRSLLEGGAEARPDNCRLFVTANRRHIVARNHPPADAINPRDAEDDALAHADAAGLSFDPTEAIGWATRRGSRSGRVARQYVVELAGKPQRGT